MLFMRAEGHSVIACAITFGMKESFRHFDFSSMQWRVYLSDLALFQEISWNEMKESQMPTYIANALGTSGASFDFL